jgi:hypothetical protein
MQFNLESFFAQNKRHCCALIRGLYGARCFGLKVLCCHLEMFKNVAPKQHAKCIGSTMIKVARCFCVNDR